MTYAVRHPNIAAYTDAERRFLTIAHDYAVRHGQSVTYNRSCPLCRCPRCGHRLSMRSLLANRCTVVTNDQGRDHPEADTPCQCGQHRRP